MLVLKLEIGHEWLDTRKIFARAKRGDIWKAKSVRCGGIEKP